MKREVDPVTVRTTLADEIVAICAMEAPLAARLAAYAEKMREHGSPFADEYDRLVGRLKAGAVGGQAPRVGEPMPPFRLPDGEGRIIELAALLDRGPVVVSFNRGHWCPFCRIELSALSERLDAIDALGATLVSIMPERPDYTARASERHGGRFQILTDVDCGYALWLGLVMWVGDRIREMMTERGLRLDEFQGNDAWFLPLPATFVVGRDGRVAACFVDPDFRDRMAVEEILEALERLAG